MRKEEVVREKGEGRRREGGKGINFEGWGGGWGKMFIFVGENNCEQWKRRMRYWIC